MAKWDFKIVGASFVKELVPVADDVQPRSQSFMQPSFHLEGGKIVMKESGQYVTAIYFPQIGEIAGVAPADLEDAYDKLIDLVENFNGGGGTPQNLAQTLAIDNKTNEIPIISNNENGYAFILDDRTIVGNDFGGEKNIKFEEDTFTLNSTVRYLFNGKGIDIGTTSDGLGLPRLTTTQMNAIVAPTEGMIVYNTTESATYQYNGATWNALGGGGTPYTPPYQELIFTAFQTAPQTGITSGTLIEGGRYTITNADITADFTISGAPNNDVGTVFIANATPPDWGVLGELSFSGNPIVTILNNPLSDTYTSGYTDIGSYYLEGLLDFPLNTFPKYGDGYVDVVQKSPEDFTGVGQSAYLWYKNPSNDKQIIFRSGASGDLTDDILDGSQLFIVKIFNS